MSIHQDLSGGNILWSVIDQLPITIYIKDVDCKFTYVNFHGAKNFGLDHPDDILGKNDADFFDANQTNGWIAQEKKIMSSGEYLIDQTYLEIWKDGRHRWTQTSKFPMHAHDGTVLGLFGMKRDITKSERIKLAVAGSREGLWYRTLNNDEVWYSPHWKKILGYTDEDLINQRIEFKERVHPEDWQNVMKACDAHMNGESEHYECCFRMRHKDGNYRWIRSRGMITPDESGKPQIFAGSNIDITDSRESESYYQTVLDTIPDLIVVKDVDGKFVYVNEAFAEVFNKCKSEIIGKTDTDINPNSEQVKRFLDADKKVIANNETIVIPEEILTGAQGNDRVLRTIKMPMIYPGKTDVHVLGIGTDITDIKAVREKLQKALDVLVDVVTSIEKSESEEDACELVMISLGELGYKSAMLSFLINNEGSTAVVGNPDYAVGKFKEVAKDTIRPFHALESKRDLLPLILERRDSRFISDSRKDDECDRKLCEEHKIISQYVMPVATDSMKIGTLQIELGSLKQMPETECRMLDAIAAHLSIVIERHRVLQRLEAVNTDLTNQARIIGFETAASVILHDLNHSIADYAKMLRKILKNEKVRENRPALDFLKLTRKRISHWIDSVASSVDKVRRNEETAKYKVDDIIKETVSDWQHKAQAQNRKLKGTYLAHDAIVEIRSGTLKDLLSCLVINATEANARHVEIATRLVSRGEIPGNMRMVEIIVSDDGDGVAEGNKRNIYEFGWSSKGNRGHGMGLTAADLLVKSMGGTLSMKSCGKSSGEPFTKFAVYIPVL